MAIEYLTFEGLKEETEAARKVFEEYELGRITIEQEVKEIEVAINHIKARNMSAKHLNMAIEALEKQIPKKIESACMNNGIVGGCCPTCKGTVKIIPTWLRYAKGKCCDWCGQKIDWKVQ